MRPGSGLFPRTTFSCPVQAWNKRRAALNPVCNMDEEDEEDEARKSRLWTVHGDGDTRTACEIYAG